MGINRQCMIDQNWFNATLKITEDEIKIKENYELVHVKPLANPLSEMNFAAEYEPNAECG